MAAYTTSTSTLRTILAHPSLSLEHIEETTDELAEVMANQKEVDDAVQAGGQIAMGSSKIDVDEDELAAELAGLVEEEHARAEASKADAVRAELKEKSRIEEAKTQETLDKLDRLDVRQDTAVGSSKTDAVAAQRSITSSALPATEDINARAKALGLAPTVGEAASEAEAQAKAQAQREWEEQYEAAQQRKRDEASRAQSERAEREAARERALA